MDGQSPSIRTLGWRCGEEFKVKISLITACFNSVGTIRTAIESVFAQRGADVEYIVVDGGSMDGTVDVIREFEPRNTPNTRNVEFRWISEKDRGMYDAINKGIKMATGDVVGILNADDLLESSDTLAHVVDCFNRVERVGTCRDGKMGNSVDAVYADVRVVKDD